MISQQQANAANDGSYARLYSRYERDLDTNSGDTGAIERRADVAFIDACPY